MKELLIGMGMGFIVGTIVCKTCKPFSNAMGKGIEKGKEIVEDIKDEIQTQVNKKKEPQNNQ